MALRLFASPSKRRPDFNTLIDLQFFAAECGYALDRKEGWRASSGLSHVNGDKIIVKRDHGSIIDFIQNRRPGRYGHHNDPGARLRS